MQDTAVLLESIKSDLSNAERIIVTKDKNIYNKSAFFFSPAWFIIFIGGFLYLFGLSVSKDAFWPMFLWISLSAIWGTLYGLWQQKYYNKISASVKEKFISSLKRHQELLETFNISESIDNILERMQAMQSIISEDLEFIRKKRLRLFKQLMKKEILFCTSVLTNLQSDLQIRLAEQQKRLEQAKSEVEQTIKGSTELEQVSELQQARLDRQIEQFEELQRVLVRA